MFKYHDGFEQKIWNGTRMLSITLSALIICLVITAGSAWSYERADLDTTLSKSFIQSDRAEATCKTYLDFDDLKKSNTSNLSDITTSHAGKAAAISLVFGVRYATGPKEQTGQILNFNEERAQAIKDYRRCINQHTLEALNNTPADQWRFTR